MARNYSMNGVNGGTTSYTSAIVLHGSNVARIFVFDVTLGSNASPVDVSTIWNLSRYTAGPTGGVTFNPLPLRSDDAASALTSSATTTCITPSGEPTTPTLASSPLVVPLNARATFRYVASPGAEFVSTFTSGAGLTLRQTGVASGNVGMGTLIYFE